MRIRIPLFLVFLLSSSCLAVELDSNQRLGLSLAVQSGLATAISNSLDAGSRFAIGGSADYELKEARTSLGVSYFTSSKKMNNPDWRRDMVQVRNSFLGFTAMHHLDSLLPRFSAGAKAGIAYQDGLVSHGNVIDGNQDFFIGPRIGYDFPLSRSFSIGAEVEALIVASSPSTRMLHSIGSVRLWL